MAANRKSTDLERLTQPGGKPQPDDATIPVLTERLTLPGLELDISLPHPPPPVVAGPPTPLPPAQRASAAPPAPAPAAAPMAAAAGNAARPNSPSVDWAAAEIQLRDKLLAELQPKINVEFERHMRERMQPALDRALSLLNAELRNGIEALVKDTVQRVLAAEIARLRGDK